ncbi:TetR/AcrR family transcriptional regulator [Amycolatopsis sp. H20-H5]|uniref:TetR/AcrR family transcriptional regulator n=1 Tax=Amycolatopsis sp. H20-H5 TaxID=3046309 RepID=UPI002DB79111|nr:TetR/AcrR family transcriptional regulator [Amycolatopsis sp. H20-H5]MEC3977760.1 TetR/AcrR family transcriptional regulator [Amycolatopsis sp. H20-H5]
MNQEKITNAAISIGFLQLTMTNVAKRLKVRHTALYRYVPSLDHLVLAAMERLNNDIAWPGQLTVTEWQEQILGLFTTLWTVVTSNPGLARELFSPRQSPPPLLKRVELLSAELIAIGLPGEDASAVISALLHCTVGSVPATPAPPDSDSTSTTAVTCSATWIWRQQMDLILDAAVSRVHDVDHRDMTPCRSV